MGMITPLPNTIVAKSPDLAYTLKYCDQVSLWEFFDKSTRVELQHLMFDQHLEDGA